MDAGDTGEAKDIWMYGRKGSGMQVLELGGQEDEEGEEERL